MKAIAVETEPEDLALRHLPPPCHLARSRQPATQAEHPLRRRSPLSPGEHAPRDIADPESEDEQHEPEKPGGGHPDPAGEPDAVRQHKPGRSVEVHPWRHLRRQKLLVAAPDFLCLRHASLISGRLTLCLKSMTSTACRRACKNLRIEVSVSSRWRVIGCEPRRGRVRRILRGRVPSSPLAITPACDNVRQDPGGGSVHSAGGRDVAWVPDGPRVAGS